MSVAPATPKFKFMISYTDIGCQSIYRHYDEFLHFAQVIFVYFVQYCVLQKEKICVIV